MKTGRLLAILMAMTGCAGMGRLTMESRDAASGRWNGMVVRDGWERPLFLEIETAGSTYRGTWRSLQQGRSMALEDVEVRGDEIRFDTGRLRFLGRLSGNTLSGTVVDLPAGAPAGDFTMTREEPVTGSFI
jgi:hypothetical protein